MTNIEKYRQAFAEAFETDITEVEGFVYRETEQWDSIGHMSLVVALEDAFGVEMEPEDILEIRSFSSGMDVLRKKGVEI